MVRRAHPTIIHMSDITLEPVRKPFSAEFTPPGSKSLTNRVLVIAALAKGESALSNCLFADDTRVMIDSLQKLGFRLDVKEQEALIVVHGQGGQIPAREAELIAGIQERRRGF